MAEIVLGGSLVISTANTPTRSGSVVNSKQDIYNIKLPYIGQIVYVLDEEQFYFITKLKADKSPWGSELPDRLVDEFRPLGSTSGYSYKGDVNTFEQLPTNASIGDVYNVIEAFDSYPAGMNFIWNGSEWDALGGEGFEEDFLQLERRISNLELVSSQKIEVINDKILTLNNGQLSTTLSLELDNNELVLKGVDEISRVELQGILNATVSENHLVLEKYNGDEIEIQLGSNYTTGTGLALEDNKISLVLSSNENNILELTEDGLSVDLSEVILTLDENVDNKINNAFTWVEV